MRIKDYILIGLIALISLIGTVLYFTVQSNIKKAVEVERLERNQGALNDSVRHYATLSGKHATSIAQITYSMREMKDYQSDYIRTIKDLGLKLKQVESVVKTGIVTYVHDTVTLRDTVILGDTVRCFKKYDDYLKLVGCVKGGVVELDLAHKDTIVNIAHWTYKKWFIFNCKTDVIRLESTNKSPYSEIFMSEYIKMKK